jgi:hypothetical protein
LSVSCLVLITAKATQEGLSVPSALRRAILLHWDAAAQLPVPPRRTAALRERVAVRFGHGLVSRMKYTEGTNRSAIIERCAWLYVGAGDRFT